jgi:superfamily II DNA or RNA helicase
MKLFKHQQDILNADPKKCGLFLGTGTGKTITSLMLASGTTLVIAPKTTREDKTWERNLAKLEHHKITKLHVISKEEARRDLHMTPRYDTIIIDEAHTVSGVNPQIVYRNRQPYPKTSQVFEAVFRYIKRTCPDRLYLLTATPIRSPMSVLAIAWLLGRDWDFYKFRDTYYFKLPIHGREIWSPKMHSMLKDRMAKTVNGLGFSGKLSDFADVPEQTYITRVVGLTPEQKKEIASLPLEYPDPIVLLGKKHQVEQGVLAGDQFNSPKEFSENKTEAIIDLYTEFGKVLVFAKYTAQIEMYKRKLEKEGIKVFTLTGQTKDREALMRDAEACESCVVISQASVSAGYELPSFRCTVYASESYSVVDRIQSEGRTLRINAINRNLYVNLVSDEIDSAVRKSIENKVDFSERVYVESNK